MFSFEPIHSSYAGILGSRFIGNKYQNLVNNMGPRLIMLITAFYTLLKPLGL